MVFFSLFDGKVVQSEQLRHVLDLSLSRTLAQIVIGHQILRGEALGQLLFLVYLVLALVLCLRRADSKVGGSEHLAFALVFQVDVHHRVIVLAVLLLF